MIKFNKDYGKFKKDQVVEVSKELDSKTLSWFLDAGVANRVCSGCKESEGCLDCQGKKKVVDASRFSEEGKEETIDGKKGTKEAKK